MPLTKIPSTYRGMRRLKQIAAVFIRHGFYDVVSRTSIPLISGNISKLEREYPGNIDGETLSSAQRLRMCFEELGPTFVKLGQMLSLEPDIIPADFVKEFKKLQDEVPAFPFEDVREIIESELGEKPEKLFSYLNPVPIAAASISQVHFGELFSGEKIVVKVQRPDIEATIREDIKILKRITRTMEKRLANMELLNPIAIVDEFENFIGKELDFTNEAASIERFTNNFKDDPILCIPEVFWDLTTSRILVIEHLEGLEIDEVEKIKAAGLDPDKVAKDGLDVFAKQILVHGYFHADPHPGNAMVMPDGRVGLIDFGIIGFIDQDLMQSLANIFIGYTEHDYDRVITVLKSMGLITDKIDLKNFKYDLMNLSEPFYGRSLKHIQIKDVFDKVIALAVKYRIRLHRELILLFKTLIAMEGVGRVLSPEANILEAMEPYAVQLLERSYDPNTIMGSMRYDLFNYAKILKASPDLLHKVLTNLATGNQNLNMTHRIHRLDEIEKHYMLSSNRIAVGVVVGTSVLAGAWMLGSQHQYLPVSISSIGIANIPLTILLGLISYTVSTILGVWLVFTIFFKSKQ